MTMNQGGNPFGDNIFDIIEEESPQAVYDFFRPQENEAAPAQRRFFQNSFNDIFRQYTRGILNQFRQAPGDATNIQDFLQANPQQSFSGFLEEFPFSQRFSNLTRSERGFNPAKYAPTTRAFF